MTEGILAKGLTVTYRNGFTALRDASFSVPQGSVTALVGVNGAGKSTLFKALMGFVPASRGTVQVLGMSVPQALRQNLIASVRYGHMGFLRRTRPEDRRAVDEALARVNMTEFRKRQIGELSGGQKKRVFLARAMAQGASVILLDEPFTGVDVKTEAAIIDLLRQMRAEGRVMLVSTHDLGSVPEFCDRVVLVKGTVLASGPTAEVFTPANLREAFGGVLRHLVLDARQIHDDDDPRAVTMLTDDERPLVLYDGETRSPEVSAK
jgi:manganese/iron transport system ATP-binding protein